MSYVQPGRYGGYINYKTYKDEGPYEYTSTFGDHYRFELCVFVSGIIFRRREVIIYIRGQPPYPRGLRTDLHSTHRIQESRRDYYVCTNPDDPPENIPDALTWMRMWAEGTSHYVRTGQFKQPPVHDGYVTW